MRVLGIEALRRAVERARQLGALIVGDECYAEFGWDAPWDRERVPSILDPRVVGQDHRGVLAAYSLSKQSNLAGYRAAFVAGDPSVIERLLTVRKHAGLMQPAPVQHAMIAVLGDEEHVERQREVYRARRAILRPALESAGYRIEGSEAGLYLWVRPAGPASVAGAADGDQGAERGAILRDSTDPWQSIAALAELGIVAGPGHFYGDRFHGYVRLALTATDEVIAEAASRLSGA